MKKVRVLVVDDSAFMRKLISDILEEDPRLEVVGRARDGIEALKLLRELEPDVVTLDVEMPKKDGLATLEDIMALHPTPVVMVSSLTREGAEITIKALAAGAVDFVAKPSGRISLDMAKVGNELRSKVLMASGVNIALLAHRRAPLSLKEAPQPIELRGEPPEIVAVAASTGGPKALQELVTGLPHDLPVPIVIAQHMPPGFTASLAKRLDEMSALHVVEGQDGFELMPGVAAIAPGGKHMLVEKKDGRFICRLSDAPPLHSVKPAADLLFLSVADVAGAKAVGIILTGMGKDGTEGARAIRSKGGVVLAESPETCVVYGMPKSAVEAGAVNELLPLYRIPERVKLLVKVRKGE